MRDCDVEITPEMTIGAPQRMGIIYVLCDPRPEKYGRPRYVGQTINPLALRLKRHITAARSGKEFPVCCWIRKLLGDGLSPIARVYKTVSENSLSDAEKQTIAIHRTLYHGMLNITAGGQGDTHRTPTREESRTKMRLAHLGKTITPEQRAAMSSGIRKFHTQNPKAKEIMSRRSSEHYRLNTSGCRDNLAIGRKLNRWTPERREMQRLRLLGKKIGPMGREQREKIAAALRGRKRGPMTDEQRARLCGRGLGRKQSAETRAKRVASILKYNQSHPERYVRSAEARRRFYAEHPQAKEALRRRLGNPSQATRDKLSESMLRRWTDPAKRNELAELSRQRWQDPEFKARVSAAIRAGKARQHERPPSEESTDHLFPAS